MSRRGYFQRNVGGVHTRRSFMTKVLLKKERKPQVGKLAHFSCVNTDRGQT